MAAAAAGRRCLGKLWVGAVRRSGWEGFSRSAGRAQRGQGAGQADQCAGSGARRWARQRGGRRRLAWPGGSEASRAAGPARLMGSAHTAVAVVTASLHVIGPSQLTQLARCSPQLARCSLAGARQRTKNHTSGAKTGRLRKTGRLPQGLDRPLGFPLLDLRAQSREFYTLLKWARLVAVWALCTKPTGGKA